MADKTNIILSPDRLYHSPTVLTAGTISISDKLPKAIKETSLSTIVVGDRSKSLAAPPYWLSIPISGATEEYLIPGFTVTNTPAKKPTV